MRTFARIGLAAAGLGIVVIATGNWGSASATTPSACVYFEIERDGTTSTTKVETGTTTCPSLPPANRADPCPDAFPEAHFGSSTSNLRHYEMVCVNGVL